MYILRTAYTYLPVIENMVADEYEIELIYTNTVYKTKVRRDDL